MLKELCNIVSEYYNWLDEYSKTVVYEYNKFMDIRVIDETLIPSDDIEKCWQLHILNTELYYKYCMYKYKKIINYRPYNMINGAILKKNLLNKTIHEYGKKFGNIKFPLVWRLTNTNLNIPIKHYLNYEIILNINNEILHYHPNNLDTFENIKKMVLFHYNLINVDIKIYFSAQLNNQITKLIIKQVCNLYNYNYNLIDDFGFYIADISGSKIKKKEIYDQMYVNDFSSYNIKNFDIIITPDDTSKK